MLTHSQTGWTYTRLFLLELSDLGLICLHKPILEVYNISICFFSNYKCFNFYMSCSLKIIGKNLAKQSIPVQPVPKGKV